MLPGWESADMRTLAEIAASLISGTLALAQDKTAQPVGAGMGLVIGLQIFVIVGGIVGWLARLVVREAGLGLIGDVVLDIAGSLVLGFFLPRAGIDLGGLMITALAASVAGAVPLLLLIVRQTRKA